MTYPIQPGKIQAPALRDETLARTRLLDWLDTKIHRRVVFLIADAGYGKTTLLADFSRRTRLRTIWYRLDEDDRDWVGFLAHLVAAGREHDPDFAPRTARILRSLEPGGANREDAVETFLAELPSIAADGAALIFDDFHLADEINDIRSITKEIVARGPERLSIVFASRRAPAIPVAKLRSLGELAELGIADLRFSDTEMEQLFRETYGRPLEPDVLAELAQRTEGWAASLTLVQAALRERSPAETRSFVRSLSGARDELHDYLAEEVVGDLPDIQQQFLMRTSILQRVTPELAQVASGLDAVEVQSMITEGERLGLLGRRAKRRPAEQRYHPLVREFLEDRLRREVGASGVNDLHVVVARWAEPTDWQTAAHHYAAAVRGTELRGVLEAHIGTIVASGAFVAAAEFLPASGELGQTLAGEVIRSRVASLDGDTVRAVAHANRALQLDPDSDIAVLNLASSAYLAGDLATARRMAERLMTAESADLQEVGVALTLMIDSSLNGNVAEIALHLEELADHNRLRGEPHFEGVSLLNASLMHKARGNAAKTLEDASRAIDVLSESSSGAELASAQFARAWAIAWLGDLPGARSVLRDAGGHLRNASKAEYEYELADLESTLGDLTAAKAALERLASLSSPLTYLEMAKLCQVIVAIRERRFDSLPGLIDGIDAEAPTAEPGRSSRVLAVRAVVDLLTGSPRARETARQAVRYADQRGASAFTLLAAFALAVAEDNLSSAIVATPEGLHPVLSTGAELVTSGLGRLSRDAMAVVTSEATARPERWRQALRVMLDVETGDGNQLAAARLLDEIGDRSDIGLLRKFARRAKAGPDRSLGRGLARRLAARVFVHDLGRVQIYVGEREVPSGSIRRKVLALLVFLLTRPQKVATREEAMDALWPDIDPSAAANSLNQTIYFLRRVFEPDYDEDRSPGYVRQESDLVILDSELVESASSRCAALIAEIDRQSDGELIERLSATYGDRFASDFAYEDWAVDFREWLHVSYLQIIEAAIAAGIESGRLGPAVPLARRALETEPRLESLALSLLKVLKGSGAHAAAAEQYARYAAILRSEIGVEPPPFEAI